jgi:mRNA interferase MazF
MTGGGEKPSVFPRVFPRRGEIYMVDFGDPKGSAQGGQRPALVVSNDINNRRSPVVIVAAITRTVPKRPYPMNVDLPAGALPSAGTIYCHQLLTLDKTDLVRHRGSIDADKLAEVDSALAVALGLGQLRRKPDPSEVAPEAGA